MVAKPEGRKLEGWKASRLGGLEDNGIRCKV
jgi:hypothetical protein